MSATRAANVEPASPGTVRSFFAKVALMFGPRVAAWLLVAIVASLGLAGVELGISVFIQLFLKALGVLNQEVQTSHLFGLASLTPVALSIALCILALARSVTLFFVGQSSNISMEMIAARLRRLAVWEALLHPSKRFVPSSAINARVGDLANKSSQFSYSGSVFVSSSVQTLALAGVMFFTARGETIIALAGLGLVGLFVLRLNRVTRRVSANVPRELRVLTQGIERVARNTTLVRVLRTEPVEHRRLSTSIDAYAGHLIHAAYLANFAGAVTPFAGILLIIVIVASSQALIHTPGITLLSFLYLFVRFVQILGGAVLAYSACNSSWPSFKDSLDWVAGFRKTEVDAAMRAAESVDERATERTPSVGSDAPAIELRNISFRYPGSERNVLEGVSETLEAGSQLGIVGPSGCGKSTLLGLVLGLFDPTRGDVRIDGRPPSVYLSDPKVRIGYVGAEAFLIAGSIRENLRYGLPLRAEDEDLWRALADAQLRATVEALPAGLDYQIEEDGSGLSAGQKQRLCLARALLAQPHLLVLDEASANLDTDTERAVADSLRSLRGSCTTIVVSHRRGILAHADRIISLEPA